jgi:anti-sigma factor RsiW
MTTGAPLGLTCKDVIGMLLEYLEATLGQATVEAFDRHLAICPECQAYVATYRKTRDLTGRVARVEMPDEIRSRLRGLLSQLARDGA